MDSYAGRIVIQILLVNIVTGQYAPLLCGDDTYVGDPTGSTWTNTLFESKRFYVGAGTTDWAQQFSQVGCYGVVKYFQFRCSNTPVRTPESGTVGFGVWRLAGSTYRMLGEYSYTFVCSDESILLSTGDTHPWERIPVRPGDRIALHTDDSQSRVQMLQYSASGCTSCLWQTYTGTTNTFFSTSSVGAATVDDIRFSFRAVLGPGIEPTFDNLDNTIYIKETQTVPVAIYTVEVSDENKESLISTSAFITITSDAGDILVFGEFDTLNLFSLDTTTGVITLTGQLDYETATVHYLEVVIHDGGTTGSPDGLSATGTLTVSVIDVNEEHISLNLPASVDVVTEDHPVGSTVYTVAVTADNDGALNGPYTFAIASQTEEGLFVIDKDTGEVSPAKDLATETSTKTHTVSITCTDADTYIVGPEVLTIVIADDNRPPTLLNPSFAVSIKEDTVQGYGIFALEGFDNDADTLTYSIVDTDPPIGETIFSIHSATGVISLADNPGLDAETTLSYDINCEVTDGLHTITQTVTVTITDVNEAPYFTTTYYEDTYSDQFSPRTPDPDEPHIFSFTFASADPDGDNVEYEIEGGYGSDLFYIDGDKLETLESIVMQDLLAYDFLITIRVKDINGLYGDTALVNISWTNIDDPHSLTDNAPSVTINCQDVFAGDEIYDIASLVNGAEPFDDFTYILDSITPDNGYLELDPVTGIVSASRSFRDWEYVDPTDSYSLKIKVPDRDGHTATTTLTVTLTNYKVPPVWDNLDQTVSIAETIGDNVQVYQVVASDADDDTILSYTMASYTPMEAIDKFSFDSSTGILQTRSGHTLSEDYESGSTQYVFTFTARDFLYTSDVGTLTVDIDGINEHPQFLIEEYYATTQEGAASGTVLTVSPSWSVSDPDGNGVSYSELTGPYSEYFDINTDGSVETTTTPTDCDDGQSTSMYVEVRVTDGALTDKAMLYIEVECVNDRPVVFSQNTYTGTVTENTYGGASILQTTATDEDYPEEHATITYSIDGYYVDDATYTGDLFFEIDPSTGVISVAHQVNFESYTYIEFTIRATDGVYEDTALVNITITDANDIRPMFIEDFQDTEYPSYTEIGTVVAQVSAYDNDTGSFGSLRYSLLMEENLEYFSVDEVTGVVTVHQPMEPDITYVLYVFAQDQDLATPQISTASIIRLDSYSAWKYHIDIHTSLDVDTITASQQGFIDGVNQVIAPWFCRIAEIRAGTAEPLGTVLTRNLLAEDGESIVTIYALEDDLASSQAYIDVHKSFVYRDDILAKLRKNLYGDPTSDLTDNMESFSITKVEPTYPIWWIDTVAGVATIGVLAFLLCAGCVAGILGTCYYYRLACFKYCDRQPEPVLNIKPQSPPAQANIFDFNYHQYDDDKTPVPVDRTPSPFVAAKPETPSQIQLEEKPLNTYSKNIPTKPDSSQSRKRVDSASTVHTQIIPKYSYSNNMTTTNMGYRLDY